MAHSRYGWSCVPSTPTKPCRVVPPSRLLPPSPSPPDPTHLFLAFSIYSRSRRQGHTPQFLAIYLSSVLYPTPIPAPSCSLFVTVMDPRGTTAKRQKWGRFLPHQRANVDQMHSSNYGPENEWVLLTHAQ